VRVGVLREVREHERRVALVPEVVAALVAEGHDVVVEAGAGARAHYADAEYADAGALVLVDAAAVCATAECLVKVASPTADERALLRSGQVVVAFLNPLGDPAGMTELAGTGATAIAIELVPRITRAQSMDALSSQATAAGYRAVLYAASTLPRFFPLLMTAAGTVKPARVLVLGAGVAGLQAIATSRRLGAVVTGFDVRPAVKEQVESLGARFLELDLGAADTETAGGYARELDEDAHRREQELVADAVADADVVITTALIPGRAAPVLITDEAVARMRPGSVIVDLAAEAGGNCVLTEPGHIVERHGVTLIGTLNLPASMAQHASQLYAKNVQSIVRLLAPEGALVVDMDDEIVRESVVTHDGLVVNPRVAALTEGR
jgi:H+-translocating NAD(P) transhydrogenase subunit alpha